MQKSDQGSRQQQAEMSAGMEARDTIRREAQSAREAMHDARDEMVKKAREFGSEAKSAAVEQAEIAQRDVGASLSALGGALRAAGDHLEGSNQRATSRVIRQAADGIENFAGSLKNRPFADVVEDVRAFGRENSGMLFVGSLLAGLALGRLVKSSPPESQHNSQRGRQPQESGDGKGRQADAYSESPETRPSEQDFPSGRQETYSGPVTRSSGYE